MTFSANTFVCTGKVNIVLLLAKGIDKYFSLLLLLFIYCLKKGLDSIELNVEIINSTV
jgi:hypothetical protein